MEDSNNGTKPVQLLSRPAKPQWDRETYALAGKILSRFGNIPFQDREDIIQDFAAQNPTFQKFHGKSKFSTWLYSSLSNKALDFLKKRDQTRTKPEKRVTTISLTAPEGEKERPVATPSEDQKNHPPDIDRIVWDYQVIRVWGKDVLGYPLIEDAEIEYIEKHLLVCERCQRFAKQASDEQETNKIASQMFRYGPVYVPSNPTWNVDQAKLADPDYYWRDVVEYVTVWQGMIDAVSAPKQQADRINMPDDITQFLNEEAEREKKRQALIKDIETQIATLTDQKNRLMGIKPAIPIKGQRVCGTCGEPGHNARTCPKSKKK